MADAAPYRIELWDTGDFFAMLESFPASQHERVTDFMANHLQVRPRVLIPGQLKQLKARWRGIYQFECGGSRRLLYEVDDSRRVVRIIYLGEHPEWEKSHPLH